MKRNAAIIAEAAMANYGSYASREGTHMLVATGRSPNTEEFTARPLALHAVEGRRVHLSDPCGRFFLPYG